MENTCHYVSSRGLLKSCHIHSPAPQSSCNIDKQYLLDIIQKKVHVFDGMSIYVCSDLLSFFVTYILPYIRNKFTLVSGDSDMCVPLESLNERLSNILINNPYLIKWYAQNTRIQNDNKIIQLPIGLDYHTILNNPQHNWKSDNEGYLPIYQETILQNIKTLSKPFYERKLTNVYINFTLNADRFGQRKDALNKIPKHLLHYNSNFTKRTQLWKEMTNFAFILSPFGIGMDCHRTWEALILGCIPIVKATNFTSMFKDLPVLIVSDWTEITPELLANTISNFKNLHLTNKFNYAKLTLSYWTNLINNK